MEPLFSSVLFTSMRFISWSSLLSGCHCWFYPSIPADRSLRFPIPPPPPPCHFIPFPPPSSSIINWHKYNWCIILYKHVSNYFFTVFSPLISISYLFNTAKLGHGSGIKARWVNKHIRLILLFIQRLLYLSWLQRKLHLGFLPRSETQDRTLYYELPKLLSRCHQPT